MASSTLHGARTVLWIGTTPVGFFRETSYGVSYDVAPVWTLGRASVAELVYTGMDVVNVECSGYRVLDHGPFAVVDADTGASLMPKLQDLLSYPDITLSIHDRQTSDPEKGTIMVLTNVKAVSFRTSTGARGLQDLSVQFQGIHYSDEAGAQNEPAGATELPAPTN